MLLSKSVGEGHAFQDRRSVVGVKLELQAQEAMSLCQKTVRRKATHQRYDIVEKMSLSDRAAHRPDIVHMDDVDMEMICAGSDELGAYTLGKKI